MSIKIMSQVWELDLPHNVQSIFLALADHADDDGYCYPSVGRLAWRTGYGVRQVQRTLKELRDRFYREINQSPVMPLHYCYEHGEKRRQGRTQQWGHILPKQSDGDEDSYCMETREGWRVGTE